MIRFGSIKQRLIAMHVIAVLAAAAVLPLALYWSVDTTARRLHERALREQAGQIVQYLHRQGDGNWTLDLPERLRQLYSAGYERYGFAVLTQAGQVLFSNFEHAEPLPHSDRLQDHPVYFERHVGQSRLFGAIVPAAIDGQHLWVQISEDEAHRDVLIDDIVAEFLPHVAWVIVPILLALLGIDLLIFRKALHPLEEASALAQQIGPARTDLRLPETRMPRDVLPLVRAVNEALDRLERGFTAQRDFVADAAHELRTPLAILRAQLEAIADQGSAAELFDDIDTMTRIVNQLIDVAESDTLTIKPGDVADLHAVAADVAAFMAPVAVSAGKSIAITGEISPVWVEGNGGALFQAIRNLVENAITHTASRTTVEIAVRSDGSVVVRDEGQGIPAEQRDLIFQRFWRGDRRSTGSAGLGLSIVARVVKAHGGSIAVADAPVRGLAFSIKLRRAVMRPDDEGNTPLERDSGT
jgi:signal transduction histidine kinase